MATGLGRGRPHGDLGVGQHAVGDRAQHRPPAGVVQGIPAQNERCGEEDEHDGERLPTHLPSRPRSGRTRR